MQPEDKTQEIVETAERLQAIVGRESLVKHAHRSADGGEFVHHIDVDVPVCKVQSSLDSGDSSADH